MKIGRVSIKKRGNSYYLHYSDPYLKGPARRQRRSVGPNKNLAIARAGEINARIERGMAGLPADNEPIDCMINEYMLRARANNSPGTVARYRSALSHWADFFRDRGMRLAKEVTSQTLEQYKAWRLEQGARTQTINVEVDRIKSTWAYSMGAHPFRTVKKMSATDKKPPRYLSESELTAFFGHAKDLQRVYFLAYLYTGARMGELWTVRRRDILNLDTDSPDVLITNHKTRHITTLPISEAYAPELRAWVSKMKPGEGVRVWPRPGGSSIIYKWCRSISKKAGLVGVSPHTFRHTFAARFLAAGGDLAYLKELLGHSTISSTMIYSHLVPSRAREIIDKMMPPD